MNPEQLMSEISVANNGKLCASNPSPFWVKSSGTVYVFASGSDGVIMVIITFGEPAKFFGCEHTRSGNHIITYDIIIRIARVT